MKISKIWENNLVKVKQYEEFKKIIPDPIPVKIDKSTMMKLRWKKTRKQLQQSEEQCTVNNAQQKVNSQAKYDYPLRQQIDNQNSANKFKQIQSQIIIPMHWIVPYDDCKEGILSSQYVTVTKLMPLTKYQLREDDYKLLDRIGLTAKSDQLMAFVVEFIEHRQYYYEKVYLQENSQKQIQIQTQLLKLLLKNCPKMNDSIKSKLTAAIKAIIQHYQFSVKWMSLQEHKKIALLPIYRHRNDNFYSCFIQRYRGRRTRNPKSQTNGKKIEQEMQLVRIYYNCMGVFQGTLQQLQNNISSLITYRPKKIVRNFLRDCIEAKKAYELQSKANNSCTEPSLEQDHKSTVKSPYLLTGLSTF